ncbi:hypothetical protein FB45DRAFT_365579 [Roridomyces roridus]|uniref:F-box domain-containing protein n=1 Tax=Roridomyces roridus TaxID=1738132 RepID=A0AAD7C8V9_9AGAR|nr:hypothetical protein FB45DRAFT_365579 [Roridomyces roridus]
MTYITTWRLLAPQGLPFTPSTSFMSLSSINLMLGLDLILEILDCLAVPLPFHQRASSPGVLANCCLVCKAWLPHAQKLLFRRIILPHNIYSEPYLRGTTRNSLPSFLAAIDPANERGKRLASCVLSLTVRHTGRDRVSDSSSLATALLRTPNLRHLDVTTISCDFDAETLSLLRKKGPRITSLCILQDFSFSAPRHIQMMHDVIAAFPSIRLLEISSAPSGTLHAFDPPPNLSLASLKIHTKLVADIGPCLASLLGHPPTSNPKEVGLHGVGRLGRHNDTSGPGLQLLAHNSADTHLPAHSTHLRSLSVKTIADAEPYFAHCPNLERLELSRFPHPETFERIPRTLIGLAISGPPLWESAAAESGKRTTVEGALISALEAFPRLESLTWSVCPIREFVVLDEWCRKRGVGFRFSSGVVTDDNTVELELRQKYLQI